MTLLERMARALTADCYQDYGVYPRCKLDRPCGDCQSRADRAAVPISERLREALVADDEDKQLPASQRHKRLRRAIAAIREELG